MKWKWGISHWKCLCWVWRKRRCMRGWWWEPWSDYLVTGTSSYWLAGHLISSLTSPHITVTLHLKPSSPVQASHHHHQSPHQPSNVEDQHSATNLDTDENMHSEDYDMNTQLQNDPTQVLLKSYSVPFINRPFQKLNLYFENLRFCQIWILIF